MMKNLRIVTLVLSFAATGNAWIVPTSKQMRFSTLLGGFKHGEGSCFLPLEQMDQDYLAPRIIQIAGAYPGVTAEDIMAVSSEPAPEPGQWTYDFSDPDGPQLGTVAIAGSATLYMADDPIVLIAEHQTLGVPMPSAITDPVDLILLVDRSRPTFAERKFLVVDVPGTGVVIGAYNLKDDIPAGGTILGQVMLVQIPWLPSMAPTKTGFAESDDYYSG